MDEVTKVLHGDPNKPGDVGYYGLKGLMQLMPGKQRRSNSMI
jgi:hypothetical protein